MTDQVTKQEVAVALEKATSGMDRNEQTIFYYTLKIMLSYKSKAAKARRLREFKEWLDEYRADKAHA